MQQEGSRVYTPVRLGFPRETQDEATYQGHRIAKGTVSIYDLPSPSVPHSLVQLTIMNLFAANHDPNVFDRPDEFLPERWMNGHKGRTDVASEPGDKLGMPHLTFGVVHTLTYHSFTNNG